MYFSILNKFIPRISSSSITPSEICRIITLETLQEFGVSCAMISEVSKHETLHEIGSFNLPENLYRIWKEVPLSHHNPMTAAITSNKNIWINSLPKWPSDFKDLDSLKLPSNFKSIVVTPLHYLHVAAGALTFFSTQRLAYEPEFEAFITSIGNILSMSLQVSFESKSAFKSDYKNSSRSAIARLSDRQKRILKLVAERKTNARISELLGFSESTVRQETMKIYAILNVKSRFEAADCYKSNWDLFTE